MKSIKEFETERLRLTITAVEDAAFIVELFNTPGWLQFIGDRKVYENKDAEAYILNRMSPQFERLGFSNYTVTLKSSDQKIGTCGLFDRDGLEGVDIGFAFLPDHMGKGYGYESSMEMLRIGFEEFSLPAVSGITVKENIPSQKLMEKLGMRFIKIIRIPNDDEDLMLYRIERPGNGA